MFRISPDPRKGTVYSPTMLRPPIRAALATARALRCPACKRGALFAKWITMRRKCPECGLPYYRESGYFVGAMFLNYGFTAGLIIGFYLLCLALHIEAVLHTVRALMVWMLFGVTLSLLLVRHSYSLWLSLDYWLEPWAARSGFGEGEEG